MRISDWSSDVCSSDLQIQWKVNGYQSDEMQTKQEIAIWKNSNFAPFHALLSKPALQTVWGPCCAIILKDRKSVVSGKSVSVRVDLGGRRIIKKKKLTK